MRELKKPDNHILAILCADLHLSLQPPIARSAEPNWLGAMACQLRELADLSINLNGPMRPNVPIICAGDIFDKALPSVELINFALLHLPQMYAVAGNHDLLYHRYNDIHRSGYWTLMKVGRIENIPPHGIITTPTMRLHGFPCGFDPKPIKNKKNLLLDVAVVHQYVWTKQTGYLKAPEGSRLKEFRQKVKGFDVAVVGDNHIPFTSHSDNECSIFNCGGFFRRKIDEIDHKPSVGLLHANGTITRHYLNVSKDKFLTEEIVISKLMEGIGYETFIEELRGLADHALDFGDAVVRLLEREKTSKDVKELVLKFLGRDK